MGWLFGHSTKKELVDHLLTQGGPNIELVDHSLVGNNLWLLYKLKDKPDERVIVLCLLGAARVHPDYCRWGYKDMDESMGPYRHNCPERLLAQSTCMEENAVAWRTNCREARSRKVSHAKWLKTLKPGDKVRWGRSTITLDSSPFDSTRIWNRRGRVIGIDETGAVFRYRTRSIQPLEPA